METYFFTIKTFNHDTITNYRFLPAYRQTGIPRFHDSTIPRLNHLTCKITPIVIQMRLLLFLIGMLLLNEVPSFGQGCSSPAEQQLANCNISDPNDDDECLRMTFSYYFDYLGQQQPAPTTFEVKQANLNFKITGNGYFDIANCVSNYQYGYFVLINPREIAWVMICRDNPPGHFLPYGDCQNPLLSLAVVGEPGALVNVTPDANLWFFNGIAGCDWEDRCPINSYLNSETKSAAVACSSDFSLRLDGIPSGDPGEEVQLNLVLENNSASAITLDELDFKIKITDEHGTLGGIFLDPNTNNNDPPAIEYQNGDEYYYLLNSLMGGNTIPAGGEVSILAFAINEPEGLENLLGESNISVNFARMNIAGGTCCAVDVSGASSTVTFPGELPCTSDEVTFNVRQIDPSQLNDCQVGIEIHTTINSGGSITLKSLLFDLLTETSGNLQIVDVQTPQGFSANYDCGIIPCQQGGNYPICYGCTTQFEYNGAGITLNSGDVFQIIFGGLNGQLDVVELLQASIYIDGSSGSCIPKIDIDPSLTSSLPLSNGCNFCNNVNVTTDAFLGTNEPLELCEQGFSIRMDITGSPISLEEVVIEFEVMADGPINLEAFPLTLCNFNGSNNCQPPGQTSCVSVNNNTVTYRICSTSPISGQFHLLDVVFSHAGAGQNESCVNGIYFTENTSVNLGLQGTCIPMYDMSNDPFPLCSSCDPDVNTLSGAIYRENGDPVLITLNANLDPDASCSYDPIEAITLRARDQGTGCVCVSTGCPEEITGTTIDPCGFYSEVFNCSQNNFNIQPFKNNNWVNGVTTYDIVLITKHLLGVEFLDSPYKIIAADANRSKTVTTFDLVALRKLILFIDTKIPNNTSWRFIPASYDFPDPTNPWAENFPECINVDMTNQTEALDQDFIAIKVGDVNLSASTGCSNMPPFSDAAGDRAAEIVQLHCAAGQAVAGQSIVATFYVESPADLVAWQLGLNFDTDYLELETAGPGGLDFMTPGNFGLTEKEEGKLRVLWYAEDTRAIPFSRPREAFRLKFKVKRSFGHWADVLNLDEEVLLNAAWEENEQAHRPSLAFRAEPFANLEAQQREASVTAVPNPFTDQLTIRVVLPTDEWIAIEVFDATGRRLAHWEGETTDGATEAKFDTRNWGKGTLNYRVLTARKVLSGTIQRL